jgi:hypothetical protein
MEFLRRSALLAAVATTLVVACGGPALTDQAISCTEDVGCPDGFFCYLGDMKCHRDPPVCGDGLLEEPEKCEPAGLCPTACNDGDACTVDALSGNPDACTSECVTEEIVNCNMESEDGCCPANCDNTTDPDCGGVCNNGIIEAGELCDGDCPTDCPPDEFACTKDILMDEGTCRARCTHSELIVECDLDVEDGCCPASCDHENDVDCPAPESCGNNMQEPWETCGEPGLPDCDDFCQKQKPPNCQYLVGYSGSPETCNVVCNYDDISSCESGDGCCLFSCREIIRNHELSGGTIEGDRLITNDNEAYAISLDSDCLQTSNTNVNQ